MPSPKSIHYTCKEQLLSTYLYLCKRNMVLAILLQAIEQMVNRIIISISGKTMSHFRLHSCFY